VALAIFDLDNTLLAGDSDHAWGEFLIEQGLVPEREFRQANDAFYRDYREGKLDILAYLRFALDPLKHFDSTELKSLHERFMTSKIEAMILPKALALIDSHRRQGDTLLIITATNRFITAPIARHLNIENLLASEAQQIEGRYTGEPEGVPCFAEGKVTRLNAWLDTSGHSLEEASFYSDSANDLPLLSAVSRPVAVDPDPRLREHAWRQGWPIISLR